MDGFREADRGTSPTSSASGLSSPPRSDDESTQLDRSITVNPPQSILPSNTIEKPAKKKPGRKPKNPADLDAPPKQRRPRKPKDPNAPPAIKKSRKSVNGTNVASFIDPNNPVTQPRSFSESTPTFQIPPPTSTLASQKIQIAQSGNHESQDIRPAQSFFNSAPPVQQQQQTQPPPPQRTSGQNYDPIRSNYDPVRETIVNHTVYSNNTQGSPIQPSLNHRASASPSISSLVDPPNQALTSPSIATQSFFNQQQQQQARFQREEFTPSMPTTTMLESSSTHNANAAPMSLRQPEVASPPITTNTTSTTTTTKKVVVTNASPKPPKAKNSNMNQEIFPAPPPLPGSGIMGGTDGTEFRAPTIILSIPMNGEPNKYVNFSRLAEEQYGWDALHPRLAAQRDRLARVAAAGAALERTGSKESGDEMSLDSDAEEGSNVEMGGMSDGRTGTDSGKKVPIRKRKMKEDEYDKDDGFVDDTELLWEEQAAAANDGFFVYSGPLVPEGEKPHLESRSEGPPKRGRGGGRGSRGGRVSGASRGAITAAEKLRNGIPLTGPGSRGGSITRKPRITKADRARMEQEKLEREKQGTLASMPSGYGGGISQLASAPPMQMGTTPMVFNNS